MLGLDVSTQQEGDITVVRVSGRVTFQNEADFSHSLDQLVGDGVRVLLNISDTEHINSVGLGVIIRTFKRLRDCGGTMVVVCDREPLVRAFKILNFHTVLALVDTDTKAKAMLQEEEITKPTGTGSPEEPADDEAERSENP